MGTVAVGVYVAAFGTEVVAIYVADIAVVVIVLAGLSVKLGFVDPHIGGKVLVEVVDTAVDDCDYHVAAACGSVPRLEQVDVGTLDSSADIAEVLIVPLFGQTGVVETIVRRGGFHRRPCHGCEATRALFKAHRHYGFRNFDTGSAAEYLAGIVGRY